MIRRPWTPQDDAHLRALLHYDPETGVFTWRVRRGSRAPKDGVAGAINADGYRQIRIGGSIYYAHRLAWVYVTGKWPTAQIDHKNCIAGDNRFANLREATNGQNARNTRIRRNSRSGFKGVCFEKRRGLWLARASHGGRSRHLGLFETPAEAHEAYCRAMMELDPEFARFA